MKEHTVTDPTPDPLRGLVTRRAALAGLGGIGLATVLAACDNGSLKLSKPLASADLSDVEKVVNWSNWPDYIDVDGDTSAHPSATSSRSAPA